MRFRASSLVTSFFMVVLAVFVVAPASPDADAAVVVFASNNDGTIRRLDPNGTFSTVVTKAPGTQFGATGVAVDSLHANVFWAGQTSGDTAYVNRATLGGADSTALWTYAATSHGSSISIDAVTQSVYWGFAEATASSINQGTGSGGAGSMDRTQTRSANESIVALDAVNSRLYWAVSETTSPQDFRSVSTTNLGGSWSGFATAHTNQILAIALDPGATGAYWSTCDRQTSITTNPTCTGTVYWKLSSTSAGAGAAVTGASSITGLTAIAVDASGCLYYATVAGQVVRHATNSSCTAATLGTDTGKATLSIWLVESPAAIVDPTVTGTATTGSTLTCNDAGWAIDIPGSRLSRLPTSARTYRWYLNGTMIVDATASTHIAASAGSYTCDVSASNTAGSGTSAASAVLIVADPVTTPVTAASAPSIPTAVAAVRSGSGKLTVSWTAPASNGGSAITGYTATASPGGKTCTATTTSCSISGLTNGTNYTFTVTATNAVGTGSASSASKASHPYATLKVTWRFSGRKATATWKAVTGEKKHVLTGGVRGQRAKSGSCSKRKSTVTCTITLPKGTDVLTASATTSARVSIAEGTKTKRIA